MTLSDLFTLLPLLLVLIWATLLLLVDLLVPAHRKGVTAILAALGLAAALGLTLGQIGQSSTSFNGMVVLDGFSVFLNVLFLASGLAGIALAYDYLKRMEMERGEYYVLLLYSISGMMLMSQAADLIVVFLALELLSIPLYVLAGFARPRAESEEASLKYFLLGSFSSGFVLYGVALVFGATARTDLAGIVASVSGAAADLSPAAGVIANPANLPLFLVGAGLILVGFGFKVAAVPFHMWTPDVYQGAPSPVTAFMSVGAKSAGFAALLRVFVLAFPSLSADRVPVAWVIAALTMVVGNVLAVSQTNIKRLLAYSSIAHAGYILMAFVPYAQGEVAGDAVASALFYLAAYGMTSLGAWAVVIALEHTEGAAPAEAAPIGAAPGRIKGSGVRLTGLELADYAGLGRRYPLLAAAMTVFMLSFTGIPPTVGFWGKFYLFRTTLEGGYAGLALIGLLTSVISAYYYLRVVVVMYMGEARPVEAFSADHPVRRDAWVNLTAVLAAAVILVFSIFPGPLFDWASQAFLLQALVVP